MDKKSIYPIEHRPFCPFNGQGIVKKSLKSSIFRTLQWTIMFDRYEALCPFTSIQWTGDCSCPFRLCLLGYRSLKQCSLVYDGNGREWTMEVWMDVPLTEAAHLLGVHYKRLQRAVHDGHLPDQRQRPFPADPHKRGVKYYLVNLEAARAYCEAQGWLVNQAPLSEATATLLRLLEENERLQRELDAVRARPSVPQTALRPPITPTFVPDVVPEDRADGEFASVTPPAALVAPASRRTHPGKSPGRWANYERITTDPDLPPGSTLLSLAQLCRAHSVAHSTAKKQYEHQEFSIEAQRYKIGRHTGMIVVTPASAWHALRIWWRRGQMREDLAGNCGLPHCPCLRLLTDLSGQYGVEEKGHWRARDGQREM